MDTSLFMDTSFENSQNESLETFLDQYNKELEEADAEMERGEYLTHDEVEKFFADRRNE